MTLNGIRSFAPVFLQSRPPSQSQAQQVVVAHGKEQVYYSEKEFGTLHRFETSSKFPLFMEQIEDNLRIINEFADKHIDSVRERENIRKNFMTLHKRIFDRKANFFSNYRDTVYGAGKQSFDTFCALLQCKDIDLDTRKNELMHLADGVIVCSEGAATHLAVATRELQLKAGGLHGEVWLTKERIVMNLILEFVRKNHPDNIVGDEEFGNTHFRNNYVNYLSSKIGIPEQNDKFADGDGWKVDPEKLKACRKLVEENLTPTRIAMAMAEEYLGKVSVYVQRHHFGVMNDKALSEQNHPWAQFLKELKKTYGDIPFDCVFEPTDDQGATQKYQVRRNPQLAALAFLDTMKEQKLLHEDSKAEWIVRWKETIRWQTANGQSSEARLEVQLMWWRNQPLMWIDKGGERQILTMAHMKKIDLKKIDDTELRAMIVRQAIENMAPDELPDVPSSWLINMECTMALLSKLPSAVAVAKFMENNQAWINALSQAKREDLSQRIQDGYLHLLIPLVEWEEFPFDDLSDYFCSCILVGKSEMVLALIAAGAQVNKPAPAQHGKMPLMFAAEMENYAIIQTLLAARAQVNAIDASGMTALMFAAANTRVESVKLLLGEGADPNALCKHGCSPLTYAVRGYCDAEFVELLIDNDADPDIGYPLIAAAEIGNTDAMDGLIRKNAYINIADERGITALIAAAIDGTACVQTLCMTPGINFDARENLKFMTALEWAAQRGNSTAVRSLVTHMPKVGLAQKMGLALSIAATWQTQEDVQEEEDMLRAKESRERREALGRELPDEGVLEAKKAETIKTLIEKGADQTYRNRMKQIPLTNVTGAGRLALVKTFVEAGADLNLKDGANVTAAIVAARNDLPDILQVLIDGGADVNIPDANGRTALHWAAYRGHTRIVELLIETKKANLDIVDNFGSTPQGLALSAEAQKNPNCAKVVELISNAKKHPTEEGDGGRRKSLKPNVDEMELD